MTDFCRTRTPPRLSKSATLATPLCRFRPSLAATGHEPLHTQIWRSLSFAAVTGLALGLLVAVAFGAGDFAGGRAATRASTAAVLTVAQAVSVLGALVLVVFVGGHAQGRDLTYGATAGAINVIGLG